MSAPESPTAVERAAIKEGYRALIRAKSPTSHLVELVVFGLSKEGMLQSPESAAEQERLREELAQARETGARAFQRAGENGALAIGLRQENERLLAERAVTAADLDKAMEDLTGARLSLWEGEQENARLFLAWGSARMRARRKNEALKKRTELLRAVQANARKRTAEAKGRKAYGGRLKAENAALLAEWAETNAALAAGDEERGQLKARVDEVERRYTFDTAELKQRVAELEASPRPAILDLPPDRRTRRLVSELRAAAVEAGEQS